MWVPAAGKPKPAHRNLFVSDFRDLKPGDYVVHVDHGIGLFNGLKIHWIAGRNAKEFVLLTYQNDAKLYVPVERLDLIQKYSSMGGTRPTLDRLGGTSWTRTKSRIKKSMRDMAEELLKLYARRQMIPGYAFSPDTAWQQEFEDAFEFELTRDQIDALDALKSDMEAPRPDGSTAVRRCRIRQDRSRNAGGIQSCNGRETGCNTCSHNSACLPAL